jgi:hypothetical protein
MTLRIHQLDTTCHVPSWHRNGAELVDRFARGHLARDLGEHLGPSLARQPAVVRIRALNLRVILPASSLSEEGLSVAWREAFAKALFTALTYPSGAGPAGIFRADSVADFLAAAICDLLEGTAAGKWQYAEFEEIFRRGTTEAALALLCNWPQECRGVLSELARREVLDRLLARFDEAAIERLFNMLSPPALARVESDLSIADLTAIAKLVLAHLPERNLALVSRSYALSLFVKAWAARPLPLSLRTVFEALLGVACLLNQKMFWPGGKPTTLSPQMVSLLARIASETSKSQTRTSHLRELETHLTELRARLDIRAPEVSGPEVEWRSTEWCGLFFLAGTLERLGWVRAWQGLPEFQSGGLSCLIAGIGLAIAGDLEPGSAAVDPAIALFAGYLGDPDLSQIRGFYQGSSRGLRQKVIAAASPLNAAEDLSQSWEATIDFLTESLVKAFASRVRGFRQSTRKGIVQTFLRRPGRIRIEAERIVAVPEPSPFHVALHISGLDAALDPTWWNRRRLDFEIGDL